MLAEIILWLLLGVVFGTFTGLIPGIHINLVAVLLIALSTSFLFSINSLFLSVFIVSMAITHTFLDFIPSIFLGCPDTDTELSILPGHELLKQGKGFEAIALTCYGSLAAVFLLLIIAFPASILISKTYSLLLPLIPFVLIFFSLALVGLEKKKLNAFFVFLLSGILGWSVLNLNLPLEAFKEPLLPLLTGLFGASNLVLSIKNKTKIPKQQISKIKFNKTFFRPLSGAILASPLSSFLPGLGSGQAAIIGNVISRSGKRGFLVLLGATNTLVMGFSFITLYVVSRTRTGAAVAIKELLGTISPETLILLLGVVSVSGVISFFLSINLAKIFSKKVHKIKYLKISIGTLIFLTILILFVSKPFGLLVLIISTITGIYSINLGVRRTQMMGCLLLPTIIFYLF